MNAPGNEGRPDIASTLRARELLEAIGDAVFVVDRSGVVIDANENACRSVGLGRDELVGSPMTRFDVDHDDDGVRAIVRNLPLGSHVPFETRYRTAGGEVFPVEVLVSSIHVGDDVCAIAVARDLRDRRAAEAAIVENEARLRTILEREPECVKILDADCRLLDMNPAGIKLIGAESIDQVRGWNTLDLVAPEYRDRFEAGVRQVFRGKKVLQEFEIIALDGTRRWMEQHAAPLFDPTAPTEVKEMLAVTRDVSQRKRVERQELHKQRLESLGTLAGGIAHDLNNMLSPIMLSIAELAQLPGVDEKLALNLQQSVQRASDTVHQLLSFACGAEGEKRDLEPGPLLEELESILLATFPKNIEVRVLRERVPGVIHGDATQLHQVLLNLCVNARDAMPDGGVLTIGSRAVGLDEAGLRALGGSGDGGRHLVLEVRDTGAGISEADRERIFEPFFTTKGPEKGTGLGLSSALGIVGQHAGFITVESELGAGSVFRVYLPLLDATSDKRVTSSKAAPLDGGGRTVLVVDDEPAVLAVTERSLRRMGFEVITAGDGLEGARRLDERADGIEVVLSDQRMPGMSGIDLLREARRRNPGVAAVLTSGFMDEDASPVDSALADVVRLRKPFGFASLQAALQDALEA